MKRLILYLSIVILAVLFLSTVSALNFVESGYEDSTYTFFTIDSEDKQNKCINCNKNTKDMNIQDEQLEMTYGQWNCINQRLQRTNIINGKKDIEFGEICGLEIPASEKGQIQLSYIFPIVLLFLITIMILLIFAVVAIRK